MTSFKAGMASLVLAMLSAAGSIHALSEDPVAPLESGEAHTLGQSYMVLAVYDDSLVVRLEVTVSDLERALGLGWDPDAGVTAEQVEADLDRIRAYVEAGFSVAGPGGELTRTFREHHLFFLEVADYVLLDYTLEPFDRDVEELEISFSLLHEVDPRHRNLVVIEHNWRTGTFGAELIATIHGPSNQTQTLDLTDSSIWQGFVAFIGLGIEHIWAGIDHVLFIIALVLPSVLIRSGGRWEPAPSFRPAFINIVKIVTFFTIAHTVTLSLASLGLVRLPARPVEAIIALSIAVAALINLMPKIRLKEPQIAFAFGLFHGFGFAYVLSDIGLEREYLALSLLGFNIGVEVGQVAIVMALFPVLYFLRKRALYSHLFRIVSVGLIAVALLWFFERALDFNVPLVPLARQILGLG